MSDGSKGGLAGIAALVGAVAALITAIAGLPSCKPTSTKSSDVTENTTNVTDSSILSDSDGVNVEYPYFGMTVNDIDSAQKFQNFLDNNKDKQVSFEVVFTSKIARDVNSTGQSSSFEFSNEIFTKELVTTGVHFTITTVPYQGSLAHENQVSLRGIFSISASGSGQDMHYTIDDGAVKPS